MGPVSCRAVQRVARERSHSARRAPCPIPDRPAPAGPRLPPPARLPRRHSPPGSSRSPAVPCRSAKHHTSPRSAPCSCPTRIGVIRYSVSRPGTTSCLMRNSGHPERVDHIQGLHAQDDLPVDRQVQFVGGKSFGILKAPVPLMRRYAGSRWRPDSRSAFRQGCRLQGKQRR